MKEIWVCNNCDNIEFYEREIICWKCGKGEMIFMDAITENNMVALLEECVMNGDLGIEQLYAWFQGERGQIMRTVMEARFEEHDDLHLGCFSYPDCDENPLGCTVLHGFDAEPFGHKG
jgi:hypothetical protein